MCTRLGQCVNIRYTLLWKPCSGKQTSVPVEPSPRLQARYVNVKYIRVVTDRYDPNGVHSYKKRLIFDLLPIAACREAKFDRHDLTDVFSIHIDLLRVVGSSQAPAMMASSLAVCMARHCSNLRMVCFRQDQPSKSS